MGPTYNFPTCWAEIYPLFMPGHLIYLFLWLVWCFTLTVLIIYVSEMHWGNHGNVKYFFYCYIHSVNLLCTRVNYILLKSFFKVPCNSLIIFANRDFYDLVQIPVFNQNIMLARYKSSETFVFWTSNPTSLFVCVLYMFCTSVMGLIARSLDTNCWRSKRGKIMIIESSFR